MPPIIMRRGLIDLSTRTPLSIARLSASAPSSHDLSLAAFTINIAESNFRHCVQQRQPDDEAADDEQRRTECSRVEHAHSRLDRRLPRMLRYNCSQSIENRNAPGAYSPRLLENDTPEFA